MKKLLVRLSSLAMLAICALLSCKKDCNTTQTSSEAKIAVALSLPAGCTSTAGYSSTTGIPCGSNSPAAGTVLVSNTSSTNDIKVLTFTINVTGADVANRKIPIQFTSTGAPVSSIIRTVKIYRENNLVDAMDGSTCNAVSGGMITNTSGVGSNTAGFIFSNISYPFGDVTPTSTAQYVVKVDVKAAQGNYPSGSTLTASLTNADLLSANFSALDQNGDLVPIDIDHRSGAAIGSTQTLSTSITTVNMGTPSITTVTNAGNVIQVTYSIPLTVMSSTDILFVGQNANYGSIVTGTAMFGYTFNNSVAPTVDDNACAASATLSSPDAPIQGIAFRLDPGVTRHFVLTVTLTTPSVINSSYRVALKQMKTFMDASLTTGSRVTDLLPDISYKTPYQFINN